MEENRTKRLELRLTPSEKTVLRRAKRRTGLSFRALLLANLAENLRKNPSITRELKKDAMKAVRAEKDALKVKRIKAVETLTGDYLGTFDKSPGKQERAEKARGKATKKEDIDTIDLVAQISRKGYGISRSIQRKHIKAIAKEYGISIEEPKISKKTKDFAEWCIINCGPLADGDISHCKGCRYRKSRRVKHKPLLAYFKWVYKIG